MITCEQYQGDKHVKEYTLTSKSLTVKILNLGVTITSVVYNDSGDDVVLGYDTLDEYKRFENYFGATIGRCANRIADAQFCLNNKQYALAKNDGNNALHGGPSGFHSKIFDAEINNNTICFTYISKDMEEGYPGNLEFKVNVALEDDTLSFIYYAKSDKDTIVNFTNHSYFALQGEGKGNVEHQVLTCNATYYGENDENRLATGKLLSVENTPFDFRQGKTIGADIDHMEIEQIRFANGYDHYMRFAKDGDHRIHLKDENSKHELIVETDLPGFHFYVPYYTPAHIGKNKKPYEGHCAVCLETSFLPDAINSQTNPETLLKANEEFHSITKYTFK